MLLPPVEIVYFEIQKLLSGCSVACDFADLAQSGNYSVVTLPAQPGNYSVTAFPAQNGFYTHPVAHRGHDPAELGPRYRARLSAVHVRRPLCLNIGSTHQTDSTGSIADRRSDLPNNIRRAARPCKSMFGADLRVFQEMPEAGQHRFGLIEVTEVARPLKLHETAVVNGRLHHLHLLARDGVVLRAPEEQRRDLNLA